QVPPYLPIACSGLITSGSWPMRSATGGSFPALTCSASCGASLNVLGAFPASVTTSGPSSLPMRELLLGPCASAPTPRAPLRRLATRMAVNRDARVVMDVSPRDRAALLVPGAGGRLYGDADRRRGHPW